jgi:hypothetical protein
VGEAVVLEIPDDQLDLGVVAVLGLDEDQVVGAACEDREVAVVGEERLLGWAGSWLSTRRTTRRRRSGSGFAPRRCLVSSASVVSAISARPLPG